MSYALRTGSSVEITRSQAGSWVSRQRKNFAGCLGGCCGHPLSFGIGVEWCSIGEHAMHDQRQLARQRHLGFLLPGALGEAHAPALQFRAAFDRFSQYHMGGLVEAGANRGVADFANSATAVGFTR